MRNSFYFLFLIFFASCASNLAQVDPTWTKDFFFRNAQEAMDRNDYEKALYYYEVYLVRYPEDKRRLVAVEYERAFIYYKMGNFQESSKLYNAILEKYKKSPYVMLFPPRFERLSTIGLKNIAREKIIKGKFLWRRAEKKWAKENNESLTDDSVGEEDF